MRIISGKFKGKKIDFLKSNITRPLRDSVRENIFNIISHSSHINLSIESSNILDLYSGIGSFGLECLSRYSNFVTFIEQDNLALKILKKNLQTLLSPNNVKIINDKIENINKWDTKIKYDIIFLDPPYKDDGLNYNLKNLKKSKIYNNEHLIIIHREKDSMDNFLESINLLFVKTYGRSKIIFGKFN